MCAGELLERRTQVTVRSHTTGDNEILIPGFSEGSLALDTQRIGHRTLERMRDFGPQIIIQWLMLSDQRERRGFQTAKTEFESGPVHHGPRKFEAGVRHGIRERSQLGASRIRQTE